MRVPDGRECPYYYADAHRKARLREGCHLLDGTPDRAQWTSRLCASCPTPDITQANRCETMVLHGEISRPGWRFWERPRIRVTAFCTRSGRPVHDPMIGCGLCHPPIEFVVSPKSDTSDAKETTL